MQNDLSSTLQQNSDKQRSNADNRWLPNKLLIEANASVLNGLSAPKLTAVTLDANALNFLFEKSGFTESIDLLREQMLESTHIEKMVIGSSISVTTGISIGYVIWLIRGGVLLSSVLSSLPAWRMIDPLPVLSHFNDLSNNPNSDNDSLESLIKKGIEAAKLKITPGSGD